MSSLVTINHMMLPEHFLYVVFALSVSSKNSLDSFLTRFFVIHLNFLSVQIILLLNMLRVIRQGLCLAARPGFAHTRTPHGFQGQTPWVPPPVHASVRSVSHRNSSASAHCGARQQWGHRGHPSVSPPQLPEEHQSHPPALQPRPGQRWWNQTPNTNTLTVSFSPSPAEPGMPGKGQASAWGIPRAKPALSWQAVGTNPSAPGVPCGQQAAPSLSSRAKPFLSLPL